MRILLDTHSFLWFIDDNPRLSINAREWIESADNDVCISIVSLWEIAVKMSIGKLNPGQSFDEFFPSQLDINNITLLNISIKHLANVATLPLHHRDPFDRLLIAQAVVENMPIISVDEAFDAYGITRLW